MLLVIIYVAFISLGLPDSIMGSAWPVIRLDLAAPIGLVGYISMTVSTGTIISSLFSNRLTARFGTGKVTLFSVLMTAVALFGYSFAKSVPFLFLLAIPLGLGAGSVDAALNNFVALHYKSQHMNWLHCFWGIGATVGPMIMSVFLVAPYGWRKGYLVIAGVQASLVLILILTMSAWGKKERLSQQSPESTTAILTNREALKVSNVKLALVSFVFFCATELTTGLWSSSYLVTVKGLSATVAAQWTAYFYAGITAGRLVAGFLSVKVVNQILIRAGQIVCVLGTVFLLLPLHVYFSALGLILIGLGTAPIFPAMLHETPNRFGAEASGAIMGLQMAFAYVGSTLGPPLFGAIASVTSLRLLPYYVLACVRIMFSASELLQKRLQQLEVTQP